MRTIRRDSRRTTSVIAASVRVGPGARLRRRCDVAESHDGAFGLRDELLRDDEHVAVRDDKPRPFDCVRDQGAGLVAHPGFRNAGDGKDVELGGHYPFV
jgi:hypothetical protein